VARVADWSTNFSFGGASADGADKLFWQQREEKYQKTDQLFVRLLLLEWAVLVIVALLVRPEKGSAQAGWIDPQLLIAVILGGSVTLPTLAVARLWPGAAITRYVVAAAQMLL